MEKDEKRKKHTSEKKRALIAEKAISVRFEVTCKNYTKIAQKLHKNSYKYARQSLYF